MYIGEHLGNPEKQRISRSLALSEVEEYPIDSPNCVILQRMYNDITYRPLGIPDKLFELLDGRERMITKAPVRILDEHADAPDVQPFLGYRFLYGIGFHRSEKGNIPISHPRIRDPQGMLETDGRKQFETGSTGIDSTYM